MQPSAAVQQTADSSASLVGTGVMARRPFRRNVGEKPTFRRSYSIDDNLHIDRYPFNTLGLLRSSLAFLFRTDT
jgi:hypothetical protein